MCGPVVIYVAYDTGFLFPQVGKPVGIMVYGAVVVFYGVGYFGGRSHCERYGVAEHTAGITEGVIFSVFSAYVYSGRESLYQLPVDCTPDKIFVKNSVGDGNYNGLKP